MGPPKKKLPKTKRLSGYFDQMEVFEIKLYIRKDPNVKSMSDLIRKSIFSYINSDDLSLVSDQLDELKKLLKTAQLPGGGLSQDKKLWEDYEKRKSEIKKEDSKVSDTERNRRKVIREMKSIFKKGLDVLESVPDEEIEKIKKRRKERVKNR